jgi:hypothetical protein
MQIDAGRVFKGNPYSAITLLELNGSLPPSWFFSAANDELEVWPMPAIVASTKQFCKAASSERVLQRHSDRGSSAATGDALVPTSDFASTYFRNSDFVGGDLATVLAVANKEDCCRQCTLRRSCLVVAFNSKRECFLKSGLPDSEGKPTGRKEVAVGSRLDSEWMIAGICMKEEPDVVKYPMVLSTDAMDFDRYLVQNTTAPKAALVPCGGCLPRHKAASCSAACAAADPEFTSGWCSKPTSTDLKTCCMCGRDGDPLHPDAMSVIHDDDDDAPGQGSTGGSSPGGTTGGDFRGLSTKFDVLGQGVAALMAEARARGQKAKKTVKAAAGGALKHLKQKMGLQLESNLLTEGPSTADPISVASRNWAARDRKDGVLKSHLLKLRRRAAEI